MNDINLPSPTFGQLNWNISQDASKFLYDATNIFNSAAAIFEITVIIFFVANFFIKNSYFRRPYFIIYTMGCIVNVLPKIDIIFNQYFFPANVVYYYTIIPLTWYYENFITLCNLILAMNRFSAIVFPLQFSKIWSKRNSTMICIFLILYPFLIHSFNLVLIYYRFTHRQLTHEIQETKYEYIFRYASDILYAILATSVLIFAALKLIIQKKLKDKNVEKVLLGQALVSSVFLIFSTISAWLASIKKYTSAVTYMPEILLLTALQVFFLNCSNLFYSFHHYMGLALLVIMS